MIKPNGKCKVCQHPKSWLIEALLARGASQRDVAQQHGLNFQSVGRHWRSHIDKARMDQLKVVAASMPDDNTPSVDYLARMRDIVMRQLDALDHSRTRNLQGLASLLGRAREIQLDIARLKGEDGGTPPGRLINGSVMHVDDDFESKILSELANDPGACALAARRLRASEGVQSGELIEQTDAA